MVGFGDGMKYADRLAEVQGLIAEDERREGARRAEERQRPGLAKRIAFGGGAQLLWKIPALITAVVFFVMFPTEIIRYVSRYVGLPNWALNFVPGLDNHSSLPGPLGLLAMGFAGMGVVVAGLGTYLFWKSRAAAKRKVTG